MPTVQRFNLDQMKSMQVKCFFLFFSFMMSFNSSHAQLTNAQVYDFEIGDIFQVSYSSGLIETDTIQSKFYSGNMDTLFYVMNSSQYIQFPTSINFTTDTITITNLNDPATHYSYQTCLPETDTVFLDNCGNTIERLHSNADSSCFEAQLWYSDLYVGLGGPYIFRYDPTIGGGNGTTIEKTLTYYNSNQHGECGTFQPLPFIGLENPTPNSPVKIWPNPAVNYLNVHIESNNWAYSIHSMDGNLIKLERVHESVYSIDMSTLISGLYLIKIKSESTSQTFSINKY